MKTDSEKTKVRFLLEGEDNTEVFAFFPEISADHNGNKQAYAHIGQHSACAPDYARASDEATPEQFADLKTELEGLGYNLEVINFNAPQTAKVETIQIEEDDEPIEDIDEAIDFSDYTNPDGDDGETRD